MSWNHSIATSAVLLLLLAGPAAALEPSPRDGSAPLVVAQAESDPMVEGSVGVSADSDKEKVDADLRLEFGAEEEAPPVSASPDAGGISAVWVAAGIGALVVVLLIVLLSRGGGTTIVRE